MRSFLELVRALHYQLFLCFINDIGKYIRNSLFLLFADDLKLFKIIKTINDCFLLQEDLNNIARWCTENEMSFNVEKCSVMRFFRIKSPIQYDYSLLDVKLSSSLLVKDLGIHIDHKLDFTQHIFIITQKALKMLGFIKRKLKDFHSISAIRTVYCSNVRSILEYSSIVWSPYYEVHKNTIERVQRKFLKWIAYKMGICKENINYNTLYNTLSMRELAIRRKNFDIMFVYKLLHNFIDCDYLLSKIRLNTSCVILRRRELFIVDFSPTNYGMNNPMERALKEANSIEVDLFQISIFSLKRYFE